MKPKKANSGSVWYPRYIGDYQRKTSHLSLTEHGVYAVLLDHYYSTGKALPANASRLQTICKAFAPADFEAMQNVLREFFVETEDGYRNERADEELAKRSIISEKRRGAAITRHANAAANADATGDANAPSNAPTATATLNAAQQGTPAALNVALLQTATAEALSAARLRENVNGQDGPTVKGWLSRGARLKEDILPTIERIVKHKMANNKPLPGNISYYTDAIFDDIARRQGNGPPVKPPPKGKTMDEALAEIGVPSVMARVVSNG